MLFIAGADLDHVRLVSCIPLTGVAGPRWAVKFD